MLVDRETINYEWSDDFSGFPKLSNDERYSSDLSIDRALQMIYLDFDGAKTRYGNEALGIFIDDIVVAPSHFAPDEIAYMVSALNEKHKEDGLFFVSEQPVSGDYSTIYIGDTDAFDPYGDFFGLSETIDVGNKNKNDNAFVFSGSLADADTAISVIDHEAGHLIGESHLFISNSLMDYAEPSYSWEKASSLVRADRSSAPLEVTGTVKYKIYTDQVWNYMTKHYTTYYYGNVTFDRYQISLNPGDSLTISIEADRTLDFCVFTNGNASPIDSKSSLEIFSCKKSSHTITYNSAYPTVYLRVGIDGIVPGNYRVDYTLTSKLTTSGGGSVVTSRPDLTISSLSTQKGSTSATSFQTTDEIRVSITVKNQGSASTGRAFRANVYDGSTYLGYFDVPTLAANSTHTMTYVISAGRLSTGSHNLRVVADIDDDISESNENNNGSTTTVSVSSSSTVVSKPDLVVSSMSTKDGSLSTTSFKTTDAITVSFTVKNQGGASTGRSSYANIYDGSTYLGYVTIPSLAVNEIKTATYTISAGRLSAGYHTLKVVADGDYDVSESNENNNSATTSVSVSSSSTVVSKPDLIVSSVSTGNGYSSAKSFKTTDAITVSFTVKNQGGASTGRSSYANIYDGSTYLGYVTIPFLAANEIKTATYTISAGRLSAGYHTLKVVADGDYDISESNENNNSATTAVSVSPPSTVVVHTDLIVSSISTKNGSTSTTSFKTTDDITVSFTVKNQGTASTGRYFFANIYDGSTYLGWTFLSDLGANETKTATYTISAGRLSAGSHNLKVVADGDCDISESNENNNSATTTVSVSSPTVSKPDLIVSSMSVKKGSTSTTSFLTTDAITVSFTVRNQGGASALSNFYVDICDGSNFLGCVTLSSLAVNETKTATYTIAANRLSAGSHNLRVVADGDHNISESNEDNNACTKAITIKTVISKPTASASTTAPTNKNVTVTATYSSNSKQKQYSLDNKTWKSYTSAVTMTANGSVYFRGIDAAGNISEVTEYKVSNIDKTAPTKPTAKASTAIATEGPVTITVTYSSDSKQKQYSLDNKTWKAYTSAVKMTANGKVYFRGIDAAGNISAVTTYTVSNIEEKFSGDIGYNGNYEDRVQPKLAYSGLYTIKGSFGKLNGSVSIMLGKKTVASGKLKNGALTFNKGKNVLLDSANKYTIVVKNSDKGKSASKYSFTIKQAELFTKGNSADDNWKSLPAAYQKTIAKGTAKANVALFANEWVGYGDKTDFRKLTINQSGRYDFTITEVSNPTTLTLYTVNAKGALSKYKTITVNGTKAHEGAIKGLLMTAGTTYYVEVKANNDKKAKNTSYKLTVTGVGFTEAKNSDDSWTVSGLPTLAAGKKLTDWVGYGDKIDYRALTVDKNGGFYSFDLSGAENNVKLTVYAIESNKLKQVKSVTATAKKPTVSTGDLCLKSGTKYCLAVEAPNAAKAQNSHYTVAMTGKGTFKNPGNETWEKATLLKKGVDGLLTTATGGDKVDYFDISAVSKKLKLDMGIGKVKVSFYDKNKHAVKVSSLTMANSSVKKNVSSLTLVANDKTTDAITLGTFDDAIRYLKIEAATSSINTYKLSLLA